ncbi:hypothetical protein N7U66_13670 [Lacinutrix neustonica]|uniref:DUF4920 domain-containing protein n=1 Tax=Lacinutrix neustonica TaxID=2980107 RepID=A0A9E8MTT0_9FLAO|nr:hypothetical protein [Lacinutrix neustonica]WAC01181.1 hypothetical protein N7U66_13670 [Lacinutrix neustonica]
MKYAIVLLLLCFSAFGFAQDSTMVKVDAPKIIALLPLGKTVTIENVTIEFVEVVGDSRCAKGVQCVWAGEVVVFVDVFKDEKKIDRKKMTFGATGNTNDIYVDEGLTISALKVIPYPVYKEKIAQEDYKIELYVKD